MYNSFSCVDCDRTLLRFCLDCVEHRNNWCPSSNPRGATQPFWYIENFPTLVSMCPKCGLCLAKWYCCPSAVVHRATLCHAARKVPQSVNSFRGLPCIRCALCFPVQWFPRSGLQVGDQVLLLPSAIDQCKCMCLFQLCSPRAFSPVIRASDRCRMCWIAFNQ